MTPKHGDRETCWHCGQPIWFEDVNYPPNSGTWLHVREYETPESAGRHPSYCNETKARPL